MQNLEGSALTASDISSEEVMLLHRARQLDQAALAEIHVLYYPVIYKYMALRLENIQLAEDLTGEVFLRLIEAFQDKKAPNKTIKGWLYGASALVLKEYFRHKQQTTQTELSERLASDGLTLAQETDNHLLFENLISNLDKLSEDQKKVLALRFGFDLPFHQVAEAMGKKEGAVKMIQARAIKTLSRQLVMWQGIA